MKNYWKLSWGILCLFFLASCAKVPPPPPVPPAPPQYSYSKDAVKIQINSDSQLNLYQSSPHTLLLCVYQLSDPNAFYRLTGDIDGIYKLLSCSQFDPSVTHSKRFIVQPDQKVTYTLDRAEGTKYVAIGAGYYNVRKEDVTRLFEIPVVEKKSETSDTLRVLEPDVLTVDIDLGPTKISSITGQ
ncbi:MAG: type VI secretion system lipoprotein TssJ [Proteobacteria bacterium]|nr:type VI secretion system lipoprotein TssJ [Pseudomonadota bacterium]MBU4294357.1 type VI secretion system lipoprotein TssJ [Pseudomonadota bacterium]MCG2749144.1 type VI secretion system lipoprotein TssJ [Desulfobulbaceae bacterium]